MGNSPLSEQDVVGHYDSLDELETYDSRQSSTLLSNIEMSENEPFIPDDYERLSLDDTESDFTQKKSWNEKQTWYTEAKYLVVNAFPMAVAFELEYCMPWTSLLLLGRLGKVELAAASVALVMSSMMGFSVLQGFVTALDTLCAQAFGSGHLRLVGMHTQRMILFLWLCCIPLAILLWNVEYILKIMVPEGETVALASQYIRIYILGLPSLAMFESLKRFLRAQGIYHPPALVLLFVTPLNVVSGWLLVWHSEIGFLGAPIALTVSHWVMTLLLIAYIYFVDGMRCWTPVTRDALRNWGAMIRLGTSGMLMVMSEVIAFNILSVLAGYFSLTHLATQPMLVTTISLTWQPAFASSVATATRIAHFIGAGRVSAAKYTAAVGLSWGAILGVFNSCLVYSTRWHVPRLLTDDEDIVILFANTALMVSLTTFWDTLSAFTNGLLRGLGWQKFGGRVCLTTYYVISMPISIATAFWLGCELNGLWTGVFIAQIIICVSQLTYTYKKDWEIAVDAARLRGQNG